MDFKIFVLAVIVAGCTEDPSISANDIVRGFMVLVGIVITFWFLWVITKEIKERENCCNEETLEGFPTHTKDIHGKTICVGDRIGYDWPGSSESFIVVFSENAFRKKYVTVEWPSETDISKRYVFREWPENVPLPMIEHQIAAERMRLVILKSYKDHA